MVTEDHPGQSGEAQADRDFGGTVGKHQDYAMKEETFNHQDIYIYICFQNCKSYPTSKLLFCNKH